MANRTERFLYLASQSPRRRHLLETLPVQFLVVRSTHRERIRKALSPSANAMENALGKARAAQLPAGAKPGIIIGADTFLYFRGRIIGKPPTLNAAHRLLRSLSGKSHWVYTGLCLLDSETGKHRVSFEKSKVIFKTLTSDSIQRLFARASPLDKAGGYAVQEDRGEIIAHIDGSRSNVIGLPLERLKQELKTFKV